ncbi:MAG: CHASE domain-containing protein [Verrucomicrobiota bacterium]
MKRIPRRLPSAPTLLLLVMGIFIVGSGLTWWALRQADREMRENLLRQTQLLAQAVNVERLQQITGTPADLQNPEYLRLKAQLAAARASIPECHFIYLMGRIPASGAQVPGPALPGGTIYFFADAGTENEAQPGKIYGEASVELKSAFNTARAFVEGPLPDEWGVWISGLVPLVNPQSKSVIAMLGMDFDAQDWNGLLARAALPPALFTLALEALVLLGWALLARCERGSGPASRCLRHLEPALVFCAGLLVTLFATWMVRQREGRGRELAFGQLAASRTEEIASALEVVSHSELESLASFYQHSQKITRGEFQSFTSHLAKNPNIQAWEWVPAVLEAQRADFTAHADAVGLKDFSIWQKDAQGQREPASGREIYYPVLHASPGVGNEPVLGFDLGSDPLRRAALEEAARSGLVTGSDPVTLVQETDNQKALLILRPVFSDESAGHVLRGFALAALRCGTLLQNASTDTSVLLGISLMHPNAAAEPLTPPWNGTKPPSSRLCTTRPVMAFGKTFAVTATAGPEFLALYPSSAWLTTSTGLLLSIAAALLISVLHRRREKLEYLVRMRSSELLESSSRLQIITDSANDAIVMMEDHGYISFWNPAAERMFGYTRAEAIGQSLHELIVPERHREAHNAALPVFQQTGQGAAIGKTVDLEAVHKDGREMPVQLSLSAIHSNHAWHAVGIVRDTTERKQAEEALLLATARATELAEQAELASQAKSEFLAHMSHEIRTPMNGVIGMTDQLLDSTLDAEQRHCAEVIRDSGENLLNLINSILDLSKIEAGKLNLEILDFNLAALLDDLSNMLAPQARRKGLNFLSAIAPDVPNDLCGDPGRLRQVLINLVGNAVKFTQQGEVAVQASLAANTDEAIVLRFVVSDTGIGIPADKQNLLFSEFSQMDVSTTRLYGGTGLGLAISKQLVQLMGGEIGVTSNIGQGSTFWFTVRLTQPAPATQSPLPPPPTSPLPASSNRPHWHGLRILLAEDNLINQKVAVGFLRKMGLQVDVANNGADALTSLSNIAYHLVLMDMQMPVMDGLEATRLLRTSPSTILNQQIPVIAMTANAMQNARQLCLDAGMNDYIAKPVTQLTLGRALEQWLPQLASTVLDGPEDG